MLSKITNILILDNIFLIWDQLFFADIWDGLSYTHTPAAHINIPAPRYRRATSAASTTVPKPSTSRGRSKTTKVTTLRGQFSVCIHTTPMHILHRIQKQDFNAWKHHRYQRCSTQTLPQRSSVDCGLPHLRVRLRSVCQAS